MQIKICGLPYTVTGVDGGHLVSHQKEGKVLYGEISYREESIQIDSSKSEEMINATFWHEVLHGIVEHGSIRELTDEEGVHLENPIDQIAVGIFNLLDSLGIRVISKKKLSCRKS